MAEDQSKTTSAKRPIFLAILCVLSIIALSLGVLGLLIPSSIRAEMRAQFSDIYLFVMGTLVPVGIAGSIGMLLMRRWGLYLYIAFTVVGYLVNLTMGVNPKIGGVLWSLFFLGVGVAYFKRMR